MVQLHLNGDNRTPSKMKNEDEINQSAPSSMVNSNTRMPCAPEKLFSTKSVVIQEKNGRGRDGEPFINKERMKMKNAYDESLQWMRVAMYMWGCRKADRKWYA